MWRDFIIKYQDRILLGSDGNLNRGVDEFWTPHWPTLERRRSRTFARLRTLAPKIVHAGLEKSERARITLSRAVRLSQVRRLYMAFPRTHLTA
jgi:hypothetical protein